MFIMGCVLPIVMMILVQKVMPESPRFLVDKGQVEEAKGILQRLYPEGMNCAIFHLKLDEPIASPDSL